MIRILSLWQPWATYCVLPDPFKGAPAKEWETRAWKPKQSLPFDVAIHATQRIERSLLELPGVRSLERRLGGFTHASGQVIAVARIVEVRPTEELMPPSGDMQIDGLEAMLGDYSPGRYALRLADVRPLRNPVRLRGKQSVLWEAPPDLEARIRQAV